MATIATPIVLHHTTHRHSIVNSYFIESYEGGYFNAGSCTKCSVYESYGKYWLYFSVNEHAYYYAYSFINKEDAELELKNIIESFNKKEK